MSVGDWTVVAASILAIAVLTPQIARIHRTGDVAGLSLAWPVMAAVTTAGWTWYVLREGLLESAWSCGAMVVAYTTLGTQLVRRGLPWARAARAGAAWAAVLALLAAVDVVRGSAVLGFVLAFSYAVQAAPAVWAAWRDPAPSGISPTSWLLFLVEVWLWGTYGALNANAPLMTFAALGTLTASAMLLRWWLTRTATAVAAAVGHS